MSLKNRLHNYLKEWSQIDSNKWINGGELEALALEAGYKASNTSRRLRELEKSQLIEKKYNHKGHVTYRFKNESPINIILEESKKMHQYNPQQTLI